MYWNHETLGCSKEPNSKVFNPHVNSDKLSLNDDGWSRWGERERAKNITTKSIPDIRREAKEEVGQIAHRFLGKKSNFNLAYFFVLFCFVFCAAVCSEEKPIALVILAALWEKGLGGSTKTGASDMENNAAPGVWNCITYAWGLRLKHVHFGPGYVEGDHAPQQMQLINETRLWGSRFKWQQEWLQKLSGMGTKRFTFYSKAKLDNEIQSTTSQPWVMLPFNCWGMRIKVTSDSLRSSILSDGQPSGYQSDFLGIFLKMSWYPVLEVFKKI